MTALPADAEFDPLAFYESFLNDTLARLSKLTQAITSDGTLFGEWTDAIEERAGVDWLGEVDASAAVLNRWARGRGAAVAEPVARLLADLRESADWFRRFIPTPTQESSTVEVSFHAADLAMLAAKRAELRGRVQLLGEVICDAIETTTGERRRGRPVDPDKPAIARRSKALHDAGKTWREIRAIIFDEFGKVHTADTVRLYVKDLEAGRIDART